MKMKNTIHTDVRGNVFFNGDPTRFSYRQTKRGTRLFGPVPLRLPHNRYSLASEAPACGHGCAEFFGDFEAAFLVYRKRSNSK